MEKTYRSKVDLWIVVVIVFAVACSVAPFFQEGQPLLGIAIGIAATLVFVWMLRSTRYIVRGDVLVIKSCFLSYGTWRIADIESIRPTHNPLSAPAASLDRLEIRFIGRRSVLVSPRRKQEFIAHLLALNPCIKQL